MNAESGNDLDGGVKYTESCQARSRKSCSCEILDPAGKLIGILIMSDILGAVYPAYMNLMNLGDFRWDGRLKTWLTPLTY